MSDDDMRTVVLCYCELVCLCGVVFGLTPWRAVPRPLNDSTWLCVRESLPAAPTSAINRTSHDGDYD